MKTSIVYTLVSTGEDIYLEQAYISMASVKHHMPNCKIVLIMDDLTKKSIIGVREKEVALADEVVVVPLDHSLSAKKRSRIIKTNFRNYVSGDLLFIDCDTIIVKSLEGIDQCEADIAACWDTHAIFKNNPYRKMCLEHGRILNWPIQNEEEYFNSGVIYVKDNDVTRKFFQTWNDSYLEGYDLQVTMDQPSFAKTNYEMGHIVKTLPDTWNCEFKHGIKFLKDAKIVHYLCSNKKADSIPFKLHDLNLFTEIARTGIIPETVIAMFDDPFLGIPSPSLLLAGADLELYVKQARNITYQNFNYLNDSGTILMLHQSWKSGFDIMCFMAKCLVSLRNRINILRKTFMPNSL